MSGPDGAVSHRTRLDRSEKIRVNLYFIRVNQRLLRIV
jgi:hypothetical protein